MSVKFKNFSPHGSKKRHKITINLSKFILAVVRINEQMRLTEMNGEKCYNSMKERSLSYRAVKWS